MKQYLLSSDRPAGPPPQPGALQKIMRGVGDLVQETKKAGALVFNGGLQPPATAAVVRPAQDGLRVTDGPYAEAKEHVGGFVIVKAADLAGALEWARRFAGVITLPIEVRPFQGEG